MNNDNTLERIYNLLNLLSKDPKYHVGNGIGQVIGDGAIGNIHNYNIHSPIVPVELQNGKKIKIATICYSCINILNLFTLILGIVLTIMIPYFIIVQYFYPYAIGLNTTPLKFQIVMDLALLIGVVSIYFGLYGAIYFISLFTKKKDLTAESFDEIEFKNIRRILMVKKRFYPMVLIYKTDKLIPLEYMLSQHDYWMITDLYEISLFRNYQIQQALLVREK